jgi:hypothetical protein
MRFKVGDTLRNRISQEEGRIVRIAHLPSYDYCYVVSLAPDPVWGTTVREAIWQRTDVTRLANKSDKLTSPCIRPIAHLRDET